MLQKQACICDPCGPIALAALAFSYLEVNLAATPKPEKHQRVPACKLPILVANGAVLPRNTCAFVSSWGEVAEDVQHKVRGGQGKYTD
jgi:hypothetical protein